MHCLLIQRGDLGLPLFPPKDLHHRFLSKIKPVFLMRSRSFATSLRIPPFIVNYSGLLYRAYPGPYQCILNTGNGKSKTVSVNPLRLKFRKYPYITPTYTFLHLTIQVKTLPERPTNVGFREAVTAGMSLPGVTMDDLQSKNKQLIW